MNGINESPAPGCRHGRPFEECPWCDPDARARPSDPIESWRAAESTKPTAGKLRSRVLEMVSTFGPVSDEEIVAAFAQHGLAGSPSGIRTRRSELEMQGLVERAELNGKTMSGRSCARWISTGTHDG